MNGWTGRSRPTVREIKWPLLLLLSHFSRVRLYATPWAAARQVPLSTGLCRREYWNGLPCPSPGDLPNPAVESVSFTSPALAGWFFTNSATISGKPQIASKSRKENGLPIRALKRHLSLEKR